MGEKKEVRDEVKMKITMNDKVRLKKQIFVTCRVRMR